MKQPILSLSMLVFVLPIPSFGQSLNRSVESAARLAVEMTQATNSDTSAATWSQLHARIHDRRVEVILKDQTRLVGVARQVGADSMTLGLSPSGPETRQIERADVVRITQTVRRSSPTAEAIGMLAGAAAGATAFYIAFVKPLNEDSKAIRRFGIEPKDQWKKWAAPVLGGMIGAGMGGLLAKPIKRNETIVLYDAAPVTVSRSP